MLKANFILRPVAGQSTIWTAIWAVVSDYVALTKPPIVLLLLVTAVSAMFLAAGGPPPLDVALFLVAAGAAAAGGAGAINQYMDRDIDYIMSRTRQRPLPGRRINPTSALVFGVALNVFAFILLAVGVNLLSAGLTLVGALFYVFVYTWWLKRTTPQNIVIGGAAGALPPVIGWTAVTGSLALPAFYLFAIVFFWTPPHFWALSLLLKDDYESVGVPMLPVVMGVSKTKKAILLYAILLMPLTAMFFVTGAVGWLYLGTALFLGLVFVYQAFRLLRSPGIQGALATYLYSLAYLFLLFAAIAVDASIF